MTQLAMNPGSPSPRRAIARTGQALRQALCLTSGSCALDCVHQPGGLKYLPCQRAQRLMRNARVSAW